MVMIYEYISYSNSYKNKYGEHTVVLIEVGSFFELYAVKNEEECVGADIHIIADLLNIQVTRKNKAIT